MEEAAQQPILTLEHIYKSFAGVHALEDAGFKLMPGEIHALIGENGAGKSTLVKFITGVHQANQGQIYFQGEPVSFHDSETAAELKDKRKARKGCWKEACLALTHPQGSVSPVFGGTIGSPDEMGDQ